MASIRILWEKSTEQEMQVGREASASIRPTIQKLSLFISICYSFGNYCSCITAYISKQRLISSYSYQQGKGDEMQAKMIRLGKSPLVSVWNAQLFAGTILKGTESVLTRLPRMRGENVCLAELTRMKWLYKCTKREIKALL